jgi:pentatricopeptide repeat protein
LYLIAQGDEAGCAVLHNDLAVQGMPPIQDLYDALLRFASKRSDVQTIDVLLAEKSNQTGNTPTFDDYRALLAESDAWVRPATPVVTQLVYVPPYLPYIHPQDLPPANEPDSPQSTELPQMESAHKLAPQIGSAEAIKVQYEKWILGAARECNTQKCRALLDEFAQHEATQRIAGADSDQSVANTISVEVRAAVMEAMGKRSEWQDTLRVFHEMRARGLKPNKSVYVTAAFALRYAKEPGRARKFLEILREDGIEVSPTMYTCILITGTCKKN